MDSKPSSGALRAGKAALYLGIGSAAGLVLSVLAGIVFDSLGVVNLFRTIVMPLSLAAIILGLIGRQKAEAEGITGYKQARIGLLLGSITLGLALVSIVLVFLFFTLFWR